jgi:hypothetical protein
VILTLDIDHLFPWAAWPCSDLWNLPPVHRIVNQKFKRDRLPSAATLSRAEDRDHRLVAAGLSKQDRYPLTRSVLARSARQPASLFDFRTKRRFCFCQPSTHLSALGRTATSRASTPAFAMSCSTARSSTLCARPRSSSRAGDATTILHRNTHLSMLLKRRGFVVWDAIPWGVLSSVVRDERYAGHAARQARHD